jgi:NTP pyrophosphatase (non-canonical NTP hydrolase)
MNYLTVKELTKLLKLQEQNMLRTEQSRLLLFNADRARLEHAAIGLNTEIGELTKPLVNKYILNKELDIINLAEELGDILWYFTLYINEVSKNNNNDELMDSIVSYSTVLFAKTDYIKYISTDGRFINWHIILVALSNFIENTGILLDMVKKQLFYGNDKKLKEQTIKEILAHILLSIFIIADYHELSIVSIINVNKRKLDVRYKDNFSSSQALHRDLNKEKSAMKKS